jgi:hypothetical protein
MPALDTVGQYIAESRRLLQDTIEPYRYPDVDVVEALNIAMLEARRVRADLFLPLFDIPYFDTAGTIDKTKTVTLDPMYRQSVVYYIVGRIQLRDDEQTQDSRAVALMTKFTAQLLTVPS